MSFSKRRRKDQLEVRLWLWVLLFGGVIALLMDMLHRHLFIMAGILAIIGLGLITKIIGVYRANRTRIIGFFDHLYEQDGDVAINRQLTNSFPEIGERLDFLLFRSRQQRMQNDARERMLKNLADSIKVAVFAVVDNRYVVFSNSQTRKIFDLSDLTLLRQLRVINTELYEFIRGEDTGASVLSVQSGQGSFRGLVQVSCVDYAGADAKVVTISDIHYFLQEQEHDSWEKLVRVLTHEIMNSIGPITSLAGTARLLADKPYDDETNEDLRQALETIERRADGLLRFVDNYQGLTRLPSPDFQKVELSDVISGVEKLTKEKALSQGISIQTVGNSANIDLYTDPGLLEQILINLLNNALDAVKERANRQVIIGIERKTTEYVEIFVEDSGRGIDKSALNKIFMPFFTTKPTGSGIGLALTRQLTTLLGVQINVKSEIGVGTRFNLLVKLANPAKRPE